MFWKKYAPIIWSCGFLLQSVNIFLCSKCAAFCFPAIILCICCLFVCVGGCYIFLRIWQERGGRRVFPVCHPVVNVFILNATPRAQRQVFYLFCFYFYFLCKDIHLFDNRSRNGSLIFWLLFLFPRSYSPCQWSNNLKSPLSSIYITM